jgi:DNA-binding response OmpR family regulator
MSAIVLLITQDLVLSARLQTPRSVFDENTLTIICVDRLAEAIRALEMNDSVDAIIMDWDLLATRGSEPLLTLQDAAPLLPVIVLGGDPTPRQYMQLLENGAQDCLPKRCLDGETLVRMVHGAIARKYRELMLFADQRCAQMIFARALERAQARPPSLSAPDSLS